MSLEQALAEQTAAIRENTRQLAALTEAWQILREKANQINAGGAPLAEGPKAPKARPAATPVVSETAPKATAESTPAAESPSEGKPAQPAPSPAAGPATVEAAAPVKTDAAPTPTAASAEAPPQGSTAAIDMKALSAAVTAAATRNREGLVTVLAKYGVKRASELSQDQWGPLVADLETI
jgi:hypothetical protein